MFQRFFTEHRVRDNRNPTQIMKTYQDRDVGENYALSQVSSPSREEDPYAPKHFLIKCYCCSHGSYIKIPYII